MEPLPEGIVALNEAIEIAGGERRLAQRVGASHSGPYMWRKRKRVPAEYCPGIERETGVQCERLRGDVPWSVLRGTAVTAREVPHVAT
jgi:DNA-binding transcriptional regulator YdaS (Cro superfamily)